MSFPLVASPQNAGGVHRDTAREERALHRVNHGLPQPHGPGLPFPSKAQQ